MGASAATTTIVGSPVVTVCAGWDQRLLFVETDAHEWHFQDIGNLDSEKVLFKLDHEVRSMKHPPYARPLANRNTGISNRNYPPGGDAFYGRF